MVGVNAAEHYRLAYIAVEKFLRRRRGLVHLKEDLVGCAMESIVRDAPNVDPEKGAASTYLVRCAMLRLHTQVQEMYGLIRTPRSYGITSEFFFGSSIDLPVNEGWVDARPRIDNLRDDQVQGADEKIEMDEMTSAAMAALEKLDPRSRYVVKARLGLNGTPQQTLREIGEMFGLSRERVRQIERSALDEMRAAVASGQ